VKTVNRQVRTTAYNSAGQEVSTANPNADGLLLTGQVSPGSRAFTYGFNGTTWDRVRASTTNIGAMLTEKRDQLLTANTNTFQAVGTGAAIVVNQNTSPRA
jgi:hypothetical protein